MLRFTRPSLLGISFAFAFLATVITPKSSLGAIAEPNSISDLSPSYIQTLGLSLSGVTSEGNLILESPGDSLQGIAGTGLRGIAGTGLRGIAGTGLRGIAGTGLRGIAGTGLRGIAGTGLRASTFEPVPLTVVGQISSVSEHSPISIIVNGQVVNLDSVSTVISIKDGDVNASTGEDVNNLLKVGDYVAVAGELVDPGFQLATYIVQLTESYTAGASPIYIRAILDSDSTSIGLVYSGATIIDQSNALYNEQLANVESGQVVEYFGYSTASDPNKFFATSGINISSSAGIAGTGLRGIAGTGLR
jgi:hypothetical protein